MKEHEFCRLYSKYFGEKVDDIRQIEFHEFNGSELYEFAQTLVNENDLLSDVSNCKALYKCQCGLETDDYLEWKHCDCKDS